MSQALEDLPDPLEPTPPVPAASTDDLLSKMADEAIDRLMASADKGGSIEVPAETPLPPTAAPVETPVAAVAETMPAVPEVAPEAAPASAEPEPFVFDEAMLASAIDDVLPFTEVEESPPVVVPPPEPEPAPAEVAAVDEAQPADVTMATNADVKALLHDEMAPASTSIVLMPLRLLNAPFAWVGDRGRTFAGLLAIVTLVPTACAIIYVLFMRGK